MTEARARFIQEKMEEEVRHLRDKAPFVSELGLTRYQLKHAQDEGMSELGLSREQVNSYNFGRHIIDAIKAELAPPPILCLWMKLLQNIRG